MRASAVELQNAIHLRIRRDAAHGPVIGEIPCHSHRPVFLGACPPHIPQQAATLDGKVSRDGKGLLRITAAAANTGVGSGLNGNAMHIGMAASVVECYEVACAIGPVERSDDHVCTGCRNGASVPASAVAPEECATHIGHRAPHIWIAALSKRDVYVVLNTILNCRIIVVEHCAACAV